MNLTDDMVHVRRDPFARESLVRGKVAVSEFKSCSWCGGKRRNHRGQMLCLFWYAIVTDGGSFFPIKGTFCSIGCMEAYTT